MMVFPIPAIEFGWIFQTTLPTRRDALRGPEPGIDTTAQQIIRVLSLYRPTLKAFRLKPVDALSPPLVNPPAQIRTMNQLKPEQRKQSCLIPLAMNYPRIVILGIAWVAVTLAPAWANVVAGQEVKYTDLRSIRALTPSDPLGALVDFEATVTFVDGMREFLFVQEGQDAIFVYRPDVSSVKPGQRVQVRGRVTKGDLLPSVSD